MSQNPFDKSDSPVFLPVAVRHRVDGWTPERQREFIDHLADTGSVREAAARVGMTEQSAARLRRRAGSAGFAAAWDAALRQTLGTLYAAAMERALHGTVQRRYYHGEMIAEERVHSERLIMFLLDRGERMLGRRSKETERVMGDWDGAMDRLEAGGGAAGPARVWQDDQGIWVTSYPPPPGFNGFEDKKPGHPDYHRTLTDEERDAVEARADPRGEAERDTFFGVAQGSAADRPARSKRRR